MLNITTSNNIDSESKLMNYFYQNVQSLRRTLHNKSNPLAII